MQRGFYLLLKSHNPQESFLLRCFNPRSKGNPDKPPQLYSLHELHPVNRQLQLQQIIIPPMVNKITLLLPSCNLLNNTVEVKNDCAVVAYTADRAGDPGTGTRGRGPNVRDPTHICSSFLRIKSKNWGIGLVYILWAFRFVVSRENHLNFPQNDSVASDSPSCSVDELSITSLNICEIKIAKYIK